MKSDRIQSFSEYSIYLRIQSKCGKIQTRKTRNTDAFLAVIGFDLITTSFSMRSFLLARQLDNIAFTHLSLIYI